MVLKNYYKILELDTTRVSSEDIKVAYRKVAKKYHPDINVGDKLAEERIKDINEAYRVLSNPATKKKYDRIWNANVRKAKRETASVTNDFFYMLFGNVEEKREKVDKKIPVKGENIETEIVASIEEAFYGLEKKISLKTAEGKNKNLLVTVPAGISNGEKIRLIGQGKQGQDGGKNGDLFIKIKIKDDKNFKLKGVDIYTDLLLTPWEAALGTRTEIRTIDDVAKIYIPQGVQSGETLRIPGKGYKDISGKRGDLLAKVKVMVPKELTDEERKMFEQLNKMSNFNPRNEKFYDNLNVSVDK